MWTDINNIHTLYEDNVVVHNTINGISHEISYDAIIRNNTLFGNGYGDTRGWGWGSEINIQNSQNVEVYGNRVEMTGGGNGIVMIQQNRGSGTFGTYTTTGNQIHDNIIVDHDGHGYIGGFADYNQSGMLNGGNTWSNNQYFMSDGGGRFQWGGYKTFAQFKDAAHETGSISQSYPDTSGWLTGSPADATPSPPADIPPNHAPVVTASDQSLHLNEWHKVQDWLSAADADGDAITQYQFWDSGTAATSGYFWTPDNPHHAANTAVTVAASDLNNVWVQGGQAGGSETMYVRAFDGTDWSAWDSFNFTTLPNTPPVVAVSDQTLHLNEWHKVQDWFSAADADGDAITQYQFWDSGTAATSGYFWTPDNPHHAANTAITVAAADLDNVWVQGGQAGGSETMYVRAFDGTDWSAWDSFNFTTLPNTPPVVDGVGPDAAPQ